MNRLNQTNRAKPGLAQGLITHRTNPGKKKKKYGPDLHFNQILNERKNNSLLNFFRVGRYIALERGRCPQTEAALVLTALTVS